MADAREKVVIQAEFDARRAESGLTSFEQRVFDTSRTLTSASGGANRFQKGVDGVNRAVGPAATAVSGLNGAMGSTLSATNAVAGAAANLAGALASGGVVAAGITAGTLVVGELANAWSRAKKMTREYDDFLRSHARGGGLADMVRQTQEIRENMSFAFGVEGTERALVNEAVMLQDMELQLERVRAELTRLDLVREQQSKNRTKASKQAVKDAQSQIVFLERAKARLASQVELQEELVETKQEQLQHEREAERVREEELEQKRRLEELERDAERRAARRLAMERRASLFLEESIARRKREAIEQAELEDRLDAEAEASAREDREAERDRARLERRREEADMLAMINGIEADRVADAMALTDAVVSYQREVAVAANIVGDAIAGGLAGQEDQLELATAGLLRLIGERAAAEGALLFGQGVGAAALGNPGGAGAIAAGVGLMGLGTALGATSTFISASAGGQSAAPGTDAPTAGRFDRGVSVGTQRESAAPSQQVSQYHFHAPVHDVNGAARNVVALQRRAGAIMLLEGGSR